MSIVTKTGDQGTTSLFGGKRVLKSDPQVKAYGEIDELNSFIGLVKSQTLDPEEKKLLLNIQKDLYQIMTFLAGGNINENKLNQSLKNIEEIIYQKEKVLPKINQFVIPGENSLSAWFHVLRTVSRRVERQVIALGNNSNKNVVQYLNRLSDFFFMLARQHEKNPEYFKN